MIFRLPGSKRKNSSDEELLGQLRVRMDLETLGELYSRYMHLVYGVCLKYLKERDDSMDAVMQIFEKLIIEIPRHNIENFGSWLHVVTRNYCLMQLRSRKSADEKTAEWVNDPLNLMEYDSFPHPLDSDEPFNEKDLEDCIERLRNEQKDCIRMFYFDSRSYSEIASELGMDEGKVKSNLQNGKRNLKICLEAKNERERK